MGTPIFSLSEYPSRNGVLGFKHDVQFYYLTSRAGCLFECLLALSGMVFICVTNNVFPKKSNFMVVVSKIALFCLRNGMSMRSLALNRVAK